MTTIVVRKPTLETKVKAVTVKSYWLTLGEIRLDASFYAEEGQKAIRILRESGYKTITICQLASRVFNPPPIKREYSGREGTPYLMPTELFLLRLEPTKYVFAKKMEKIEDWLVKDGWVILTQSGNTGIPLYVTESLEKFVVSQNAIRILPKEDVYGGFLYAYLSTWQGQALVTRDQFGVTVKHIRPHHVESDEVPLLPEAIRRIIHDNILKSFSMREKARSLLAKSQDALLTELGLPRIKKPSGMRQFSVKASDLELRFDASYHAPLVQDIQLKLRNSKYRPDRLEAGTRRVFLPNRFKRIYVEKEYGVPFLSGADIVRIKPYSLKYLSRKVTKDLENILVHEGWVLVTRSGTIGRATLTSREWDGWAITEDVIRVIPREKKLHRGFLTAFLQSDYGYQQVISKTYGGVVPHLTEEDLKDVLVPFPPMDVQRKIGSLVVEAYELKELANKIEDETTKSLERMLSTHKKAEVNEGYLRELNAYADSFDLIGNEDFRQSLEQAEKGEVVPYETSLKEE